MKLKDQLIIRPIRIDEQTQARNLVLAGLGDRWGHVDTTLNPDLENIMANYHEGVFLVALLDGNIVGTGALLPENTTSCRLFRMSVKRSMRSQGIGSAILEKLIQFAENSGFNRVVLETTASWHDAVEFYKNRGFRSLGISDGDHHFEKDIF